jgi:hypothetical protein
MTKLDLTQYRNLMFADRGTDISDALDYALSLSTGNPEGLTAVYVVLNTVINAVQADSLASAAVAAAAPNPERMPTAVIISAAVRDWLADNASEMVSDWCEDNASETITDWCGDNHDVEDWLGEHADPLIAHWMNYNAVQGCVDDIVSEKVEAAINNLDLEAAINNLDLVVRAR